MWKKKSGFLWNEGQELCCRVCESDQRTGDFARCEGNLIFCAGNMRTHLLHILLIKQLNGKDIHSEIPSHASE
jgi:hypothetical protein